MEILVDYKSNTRSENVRYHILAPHTGGKMLCGRVMLNTVTKRVDPDKTVWMCARCLKAWREGQRHA